MYFYCNNFVQPKVTGMNPFMKIDVPRLSWVFIFLEGSHYENPNGHKLSTNLRMYLI